MKPQTHNKGGIAMPADTMCTPFPSLVNPGSILRHLCQTARHAQPLRYGLPLLVLLLLGGCASTTYQADPADTVIAPRPDTATPGPTTRRTVVTVARDMLGVPYRYGGTSPSRGFDCSGLVYYSYRRAGWRVPRVSGEQYKHTRPIPRSALRPGDLVFFRLGRRRFVSHVGIYIGKGLFIHAPSSGQRVSIERLDDRYWRQHFVRGGRFVDTAGS